jgi:hypothetical protein
MTSTRALGGGAGVNHTVLDRLSLPPQWVSAGWSAGGFFGLR